MIGHRNRCVCVEGNSNSSVCGCGPSLDRTGSVVLCDMNQVLLYTHIRHSILPSTPPRDILIATTHLKSSKTAEGEEVRERQVRHIISHLTPPPTVTDATDKVILCGDFNALPHTTSHVTYTPLAVPLMKTHMQDCYDEVCVGKSGCVVEGENIHDFNSNVNERGNDDGNSHDQYDQHYTTMKTRKGGLLQHIIDYIFHSRDNANTLAVREMPHCSLLPPYGLPAWNWPSDHLALQAWINFK